MFVVKWAYDVNLKCSNPMELVRINIDFLTIGMSMIVGDCESCAGDPLIVVGIEKDL